MHHYKYSQFSSQNKRTFPCAVPPLEVRITGGHAPVMAGSSVRLVCQTSGSNPPAHLTWWEGGERLTDVTHAVSGRRFTHAVPYLTSLTRWVQAGLRTWWTHGGWRNKRSVQGGCTWWVQGGSTHWVQAGFTCWVHIWDGIPHNVALYVSVSLSILLIHIFYFALLAIACLSSEDYFLYLFW